MEDNTQVLEDKKEQQEEQTETIRNPEAVLQALNAAKAQKEKERERAAALEAQIAEMNKKLEEQQAETQKRDHVLQKLMESIAPDAAAVATQQQPQTKGSQSNPLFQVLEQFNAEQRLEELKKQYAQLWEQRAIEKYRPELDTWQK